jgi:hypothetical protein
MRPCLLPCITAATLVACASTQTDHATIDAGAAPRSAGDVTATAGPDRSDADIAALRARGPAALHELLASYDRRPDPALAATIDRVAAQRYATVSRLYWYTDLAAAEREAKRTGKPILSLRMLGRLDEDLSCANSRFFRTILYANAAVSRLLGERFVLHWSSERPVPRVTIDFGDGRRLERTVTGNSAHYLLDGDGRVLDVLPGLYAPAVFRAELERGLALATELAALDPIARNARLAAWHRARTDERGRAWSAAGRVPVVTGARTLLDAAAVERAVELAQRASMMKARIEIPDLRIVDVGTAPAALGDEVALWASIGQRLFGLGGLPALGAGDVPIAPAAAPADLLDASSRALIAATLDAPIFDDRVQRLDAPARAALMARLEQSLVADTAQNEMTLHLAIHQHLADQPDLPFDAVNAWLYAELFHTPASDPWLGLLPRTAFTGLPGDGVVIDRR